MVRNYYLFDFTLVEAADVAEIGMGVRLGKNLNHAQPNRIRRLLGRNPARPVAAPCYRVLAISAEVMRLLTHECQSRRGFRLPPNSRLRGGTWWPAPLSSIACGEGWSITKLPGSFPRASAPALVVSLPRRASTERLPSTAAARTQFSCVRLRRNGGDA
jgi:hypothetical protein